MVLRASQTVHRNLMPDLDAAKGGSDAENEKKEEPGDNQALERTEASLSKVGLAEDLDYLSSGGE